MSLAINDSLMMPFNALGASFQQVYHEKVNKVARPRLNETNLDPDCYKDGPGNITHSRMLRNWDWELAGGTPGDKSTQKKEKRGLGAQRAGDSPLKKEWHGLDHAGPLPPIRESTDV